MVLTQWPVSACCEIQGRTFPNLVGCTRLAPAAAGSTMKAIHVRSNTMLLFTSLCRQLINRCIDRSHLAWTGRQTGAKRKLEDMLLSCNSSSGKLTRTSHLEVNVIELLLGILSQKSFVVLQVELQRSK